MLCTAGWCPEAGPEALAGMGTTSSSSSFELRAPLIREPLLRFLRACLLPALPACVCPVVPHPLVRPAAISAGDVKALRLKTGAGMMDCKKALKECGGDADKAVEVSPWGGC